MTRILFVLSTMVILFLMNCSGTKRNDPYSATNLDSQLLQAAWEGNANQVEQLLNSGADIETTDSLGWTPFLAASVNGHLSTLDVLRKAGAKIIVDLK